MGVLFSAIILIGLVLTLVDIITRRDDQVKHLPKLAWIIIVILIPLVGIVLWFAIGREYGGGGENVSFGDPRRWSREPVAQPAPPPVQKSTEEQLAELEREIEYYEQLRRRQAEAELPASPERGELPKPPERRQLPPADA